MYFYGENAQKNPTITDLVMKDSWGAKGAETATQAIIRAKAAKYQDLYSDIQAERQASFDKESARGQFTQEFSGLGEGGSLPLLLAAALIGGAYWYFACCKKAPPKRRKK